MRYAICGVGNPLRGDDAIGPQVIEKLKEVLGEKKNVLLLDCGHAPESFTGKVEAFEPHKIIIIDAVDFRKPVGTIEQLDPERIRDVLISTHKLPLTLFIDYLKRNCKSEIIFFGAQPSKIGFGEEFSIEAKDAAEEIAKRILSIIRP